MWNWIQTFVIIPQDDSRWSDWMRSLHFVNTKEECLFNGERMESNIVLNVPGRVIQSFCLRADVKQFVYCRIENENDMIILYFSLFNGSFKNRTYRKARKKDRLVFTCVEQGKYLMRDSIKDNRLIVSSESFECSFSIEGFMEIENIIQKNLESFVGKDPAHIFELANNGVGMTPWYYRNRIYKGCLW